MNSLLGALGVVFITLKLCGVINWSWWLVLLPLYPVIGILLLMLILTIGTVIASWR